MIVKKMTMLAVIAGCSVQSVNAANTTFQDFFFTVCTGASGTLQVRCNETNGGLGDLSSDSESSLNPSQTLAGFRSNQPHSVAEKFERAEKVDIGSFSLFLNGRYTDEKFDRTVDADNEREYERHNVAADVGFDYTTDKWTLGAVLTWADAQLDFADELPGIDFNPIGNAGGYDADGYELTAFASLAFSEQIQLGIVGGWRDMEYKIFRNSIFQESNRLLPTTRVLATGVQDTDVAWLAASITHTSALGAWLITSEAGWNTAWIDAGGYTEREAIDTGLTLRVRGESYTASLANLGLKVSRALSSTRAVFVPELSLNVVREFGDLTPETTVSFIQDASENTLLIKGDERDRTSLEAALGVVAVFSKGVSSFVEVRASFGQSNVQRTIWAAGIRFEI